MTNPPDDREAGQRFARLVTDAVLRDPESWNEFREPFRQQFDRLGPDWDARRTPGSLGPFEAALEAVSPPPRRVLDLGTGTGAAAFVLARRFPDAEIVGVDLAQRMLEQARRKVPPELAARIRFEQADASSLPFPDGSFNLVGLANMVPFFDELARVVSPGGSVVFSFSLGPDTPIYVPAETLRRELDRRGFTQFAEFSVEPGIALLAGLPSAE